MHIAHTCASYPAEDTHPHQSIERMQMQLWKNKDMIRGDELFAR